MLRNRYCAYFEPAGFFNAGQIAKMTVPWIEPKSYGVDISRKARHRAGLRVPDRD
jgi:hypothetical protein